MSTSEAMGFLPNEKIAQQGRGQGAHTPELGPAVAVERKSCSHWPRPEKVGVGCGSVVDAASRYEAAHPSLEKDIGHAWLGKCTS